MFTDKNLLELIQKTCEQPPDTLERKRGLNRLVFLIQQSGKIYQDRQLARIDYEEALQKMWLYFCRNLCEAVTAKNGSYDASQGSIFTWLNAYLKQRIKDAHLANQKENAMIDSPRIENEGNAIDQIKDPASKDPLTIKPDQIFQKIQEWLQSQEKRLRRIHIRDRAEINAYVLIMRRLPPETTWQALGQEWDISPSTLANFYQRRCLPLLKELQNQF